MYCNGKKSAVEEEFSPVSQCSPIKSTALQSHAYAPGMFTQIPLFKHPCSYIPTAVHSLMSVSHNVPSYPVQTQTITPEVPLHNPPL